MALIRFFREVLPDTGNLAHDFTDPEWRTRFLGDLYQDLSEEARKRYALLQTPEFVESWILDRTLEPAIREFGHEHVTMIDPACGSGHFLLGGFERLLREWRRFAPVLPPAEQAQRALDAIAGVDLNPFAVEIARFRLLIAALRAAEVRRLVAAGRDTFRALAERRAQEQWRTANPRRTGEEPEPYAIRMQVGAADSVEQQIGKLVAEEQRRRKREEVGDIPVPPKYVTKDFQSTDFWRLRGGLDVPKERFVSFPHCQRDAMAASS
jgi:hypothetical protein